LSLKHTFWKSIGSVGFQGFMLNKKLDEKWSPIEDGHFLLKSQVDSHGIMHDGMVAPVCRIRRAT